MTFENINYKALYDDFIKEYQLEFGMRKYEKIYNKIQTSNKISGLIYVSREKMAIPTKNDYLYSLNEVPYFIFSKADTLALAGLIALERWNSECNKQLQLADEYVLKDIAVRILEDCSKLKIRL